MMERLVGAGARARTTGEANELWVLFRQPMASTLCLSGTTVVRAGRAKLWCEGTFSLWIL